jgi:tetratricopeptide (TPR) repeat protein
MSRLDQLNAFLNDSPNDPFVHYAIAQEYRKMQDLTLAHSKYIELVENYPNYVATYYHLGKLQIELAKKEDAMVTFDKGIQIAKLLKDQHTLSELQSARLELLYDED